MITINPDHFTVRADNPDSKDVRLGNQLMALMGLIGIATKNGYSFGFPNNWGLKEFFKNPLPLIDDSITYGHFYNPVTYGGFDLGYCPTNVPDDVVVHGYLGSYKYWEHCQDLVKYYFTLKDDIYTPLRDCIIVQYRDYGPNLEFNKLTWDNYYEKALSLLPNKKICVVTDNIEVAKKAIRLECNYYSISPIKDFYLICNCDYLVCANSTFSICGGYLGNAKKVIAPRRWFSADGAYADCPINNDDVYLPEWRQV